MASILFEIARICHSQFKYFTETHSKTSNFNVNLLNLVSTCHFCLIQKIIYHLKRNWLRCSLPKFCRSSIYVITIVKFSNRPIQNLFNFPQETSVDFCKVQMQLSKQRKTFSPFFVPFLQSTSNFKHLKEKMIVIANVFPKLQTVKNRFRTLSKRRHFRWCLDSQHVKASQILAKSPWQRFNHPFYSF